MVGKIPFTNIDDGTTDPGVECIYQRVKSVVKKIYRVLVLYYTQTSMSFKVSIQLHQLSFRKCTRQGNMMAFIAWGE